MSKTEDRIQDLARQHLNLEEELDLDGGLGAGDVSSMDAIAFVKKVAEAFDVTIPPEEVAKFRNMREFAAYLDSHAG